MTLSIETGYRGASLIRIGNAPLRPLPVHSRWWSHRAAPLWCGFDIAFQDCVSHESGMPCHGRHLLSRHGVHNLRFRSSRREKLAHIRQSRPYSGLGFQVKVINPFDVGCAPSHSPRDSRHLLTRHGSLNVFAMTLVLS